SSTWARLRLSLPACTRAGRRGCATALTGCPGGASRWSSDTLNGRTGIDRRREPRMAGLRFGVWIPTYAWADASPEHVRRLTQGIAKCEQYHLDIWVIDHLLAAPGLYGVAWLEPLS